MVFEAVVSFGALGPMLSLCLSDSMQIYIHTYQSISHAYVGTELVRCCIRDYMPTFYRFLNHSKKTLIHATLALLTTMVMHSQSTATDIMAVFNFNLKPLSSFLNMRLRKKMKKATADTSTAATDPLSTTLDEDNIVMVAEPVVTIPTALTTDDIVSKDIRGVYIKFLLAFLHRGDSMVKKTVLETKNLLPDRQTTK